MCLCARPSVVSSRTEPSNEGAEPRGKGGRGQEEHCVTAEEGLGSPRVHPAALGRRGTGPGSAEALLAPLLFL